MDELALACIICFDTFPRSQGLRCHSITQHFVCNGCLNGLARRSVDPGNIARTRGHVRCPQIEPPCTAAEWPPEALLSHLDKDTQANVLRSLQVAIGAAGEIVDQQRQHIAALQDGVNLREQQLMRRMHEARATATRSDRLRIARLRIVEDILELRCPRCNTVFLDFDGCIALNCERAGCGCAFCALCLADCGADAHMHCQTHGHLYPDHNVFKHETRDRRIRELRSALASLGQPADFVDDLLRLMKPDLRGVRIRAEDVRPPLPGGGAGDADDDSGTDAGVGIGAPDVRRRHHAGVARAAAAVGRGAGPAPALRAAVVAPPRVAPIPGLPVAPAAVRRPNPAPQAGFDPAAGFGFPGGVAPAYRVDAAAGLYRPQANAAGGLHQPIDPEARRRAQARAAEERRQEEIQRKAQLKRDAELKRQEEIRQEADARRQAELRREDQVRRLTQANARAAEERRLICAQRAEARESQAARPAVATPDGIHDGSRHATTAGAGEDDDSGGDDDDGGDSDWQSDLNRAIQASLRMSQAQPAPSMRRAQDTQLIRERHSDTAPVGTSARSNGTPAGAATNTSAPIGIRATAATTADDPYRTSLLARLLVAHEVSELPASVLSLPLDDLEIMLIAASE